MKTLPADFDLTQFTGTEHYYKWSPLFKNFVLTDGAKYVAETCGAYWLFDAIASYYSRFKGEDFVLATLKTKRDGWLLTLDDGNENLLAKQVIEYSDFPLDEIKFYVLPQDDLWVILLPSEY